MKQSLLHSIRNGCHFCAMIWHNLGGTDDDPSSSETDSEDDDIVIVGQATKESYLRLVLFWREEWVIEHGAKRTLESMGIHTVTRDGRRGSIKIRLELPGSHLYLCS
jgi:hypothetical protein